MRDHADLEAVLSPLASRRAPAGFATRLSDRYARAVAARRRRAALLLCAACCVGLAAIALAGFGLLHASSISLHGWLTAGVDGISTATSVFAHALAFQLLHALPELAVGIVSLAAVTAACCVALAAIVRSAPVSSRAH